MSFDGNADRCIIKIVAETQADTLVACALADQLQLPFDGITTDTPPAEATIANHGIWRLLVSFGQRTLIRPDGARMNIDFSQGKPEMRRLQASKDQSLVRALGLHKLTRLQRQALQVVDATAGLGQDGWIIACQGCKTTLLGHH